MTEYRRYDGPATFCSQCGGEAVYYRIRDGQKTRMCGNCVGREIQAQNLVEPPSQEVIDAE